MRKKQCIAMLLAGGQGSRLGILTKGMAKPAVPFGGKYRIIDFPLSNCTHSGIDVVGVLTQYQPLELNSYIGSGQPWDLDLNSGGVYILPPFQKSKSSEWYRGTANAIYQNIGFIEQFDPEYVLILSGDHIYKMDYDAMLRFHKAHDADATIAVLQVPWEEASRFGLMRTNEQDIITEFEEKPRKPTSNMASMGVYVFNWPILRQYLMEDETDPLSKNDFGKDIIPHMLSDGRALAAYPFSGYWKDVGTIESLWEANMDLLLEPSAFNLYDTDWRIYSRNPNMPPHFIEKGAVVKDCMITEGCEVSGVVEHSVLFAGVTVEKGASVRDSVIMPGAKIEKGASVTRAIVGENTVISTGCTIGGAFIEDEANSIALVGSNTRLPSNFTVKPGEQVDSDVLMLERSAEL